jgi:hypothetical protein
MDLLCPRDGLLRIPEGGASADRRSPPVAWALSGRKTPSDLSVGRGVCGTGKVWERYGRLFLGEIADVFDEGFDFGVREFG